MISVFGLIIGFFAISNAQIVVDFDCAAHNGTDFAYTPTAVVCSDTISLAACKKLFVPAATAITAGSNTPRPVNCYSSDGTTLDEGMKAAAISQCPKTCGYCCLSDSYKCENAKFPRLDCSTITNDQCQDPKWRTIIAQDCPAACGFCNSGGCVDAVTSCANDISICKTVGLQDFVNENCQRTCERCPSTTGSPSSGGTGGSCTTYAADSSSNCANWARNGFCTNTFYTNEHRKKYCATTCKIC